MAILLCFCLLLEPQSLTEKQVRRELRQLAGQQDQSDGFWGVQVYAPLRGDYVFQQNAHKNFRPASNLKILTTLLAFEYLGADYTFATDFAITGTIHGDTLHGDLIVRGGGDPGLSSRPGPAHFADFFSPLWETLRSLGVRRIRGAIVGEHGFFDDVALQKSWEWDDIGLRYGTPVHDLSINDGLITIDLMTDEQGQPSYSVTPVATPDFQLNLKTHPQTAEPLELKRTWGTDHFTLSGRLPPFTHETFQVSSWRPDHQFLHVLRYYLQRGGIAVEKEPQITADEIFDQAQPLATIHSYPLSELAKRLMKRSQNHYADCFLKATARQVFGEGSFEAGAALAASFLDRIGTPDINSAGLHIRDGSGLSGQNFIRPAQLNTLLRYGWQQPYRDAWLATFPIMGLDGTLARRGGPTGLTKGRVWAKTGYIFRSRTLSGYLETQAGEPLIFSIMVNHYGTKTSAINDLQDRICETLIRLKPNRRVKRQAESLFPFSRSTSAFNNPPPLAQ